jgi:hypothetical protein
MAVLFLLFTLLSPPDNFLTVSLDPYRDLIHPNAAADWLASRAPVVLLVHAFFLSNDTTHHLFFSH